MKRERIQSIRHRVAEMAAYSFRSAMSLFPEDDDSPGYDFRDISPSVFEVTVEDQTYRVSVKAVK